MKVYEIISKNKVYDIIAKVANNHKQKTFNYYTEDDIHQIVWTIALEKLGDFNIKKALEKNPEKALEHWLNSVIANRLSNLYRDEYIVPKGLKFGKNNNVIDPKSLADVEYNVCEDLLSIQIENSELWNNIMNQLNETDFIILESLLSGESIPSYYKTKLTNKIREIIDG